MEGWNIAGIKARCARMRVTVLHPARPLAAKAEVEGWWPGGANNPSRTLGGWIICYGQLCAFIARRGEKASPATEEQNNRVIASMLRGEPKAVPLVAGGTVHVYPKSYNALETIGQLDRTYAQIMYWRDSFPEVDGDAIERAQALTMIGRVLVLLNATFIWIVTHPGPGVPYDSVFTVPWDAGEIPPVWCFEADPLDIGRIAVAHNEVNMLRVAALPKLDKSDSRGLGWASFLTSASEATHTDPTTLANDHSLASLIARASVMEFVFQQQKKESEKKGKGKRP